MGCPNGLARPRRPTTSRRTPHPSAARRRALRRTPPQRRSRSNGSFSNRPGEGWRRCGCAPRRSRRHRTQRPRSSGGPRRPRLSIRIETGPSTRSLRTGCRDPRPSGSQSPGGPQFSSSPATSLACNTSSGRWLTLTPSIKPLAAVSAEWSPARGSRTRKFQALSQYAGSSASPTTRTATGSVDRTARTSPCWGGLPAAARRRSAASGKARRFEGTRDRSGRAGGRPPARGDPPDRPAASRRRAGRPTARASPKARPGAGGRMARRWLLSEACVIGRFSRLPRRAKTGIVATAARRARRRRRPPSS